MKFYRCESKSYMSMNEFDRTGRVAIVFDEFNLIKETPQGYWICMGGFGGLQSPKKWISKTSRKRYAYPTKIEALENLVKRYECRKRILSHQLDNANTTIKLAKEIIERYEKV